MRLRDYLSRIGVGSTDGSPGDVLRRVHLAHKEAILFENLTIQCGGAISVAVPDLERKMIDDGRGGYCFEHNTLFAAALRDLGFTPMTLLGRVRVGPPERWVRTHMILRVDVDGEPWLADVGFGGQGLLEPIPLNDGAISRQGGFEYAVRREAHVWILSMRDRNSAMDLYEFSEEPQTPWDVEVANHFTSTHPASIFRRTLTVQRSGRGERIVLRNGVLTRYVDGRASETPFDRAQLHDIVRAAFGIELPPGPFVCDTQTNAVASL
jgi:N-hydroxyarylamine O-acetyltransferase